MTGLAAANARPAAAHQQPLIWNPNGNNAEQYPAFGQQPGQQSPSHIPQQAPIPMYNQPIFPQTEQFPTPAQQPGQQSSYWPQTGQPSAPAPQSAPIPYPGQPSPLGQQVQSAPMFNPQAPIQQTISNLDISQMNEQQISQAAISITQRLNTMGVEMKQMFFERDEVVDDLIRALVAQHHILLLGPPGTAKTLLAKELTDRITGARLFSWQLSRAGDPSEILGPYSVQAMSQDKFKRVLDGKAADAEIVYFDEINFKGLLA